ncbi:TPA: 50S ribosome-binding protein YggL [Aeromonas veronii]
MVFHPADLHKKRSRRLRKKLRVGEFQEFGFSLTFTIDPQQTGCEEALD